jgi:hypothetical protein
VPAAPPERAARPRARDPVDRQPAPRLEAADRVARHGPANAVDRAGVEPPLPQRDLEGGDACVTTLGGNRDVGSRHRRHHEEHGDDKKASSHATTLADDARPQRA